MKKGIVAKFLLIAVTLIPAVICFAAEIPFPINGPEGQKIWGLGPLYSQQIRFLDSNRILTWNPLGIYLWGHGNRKFNQCKF